MIGLSKMFTTYSKKKFVQMIGGLVLIGVLCVGLYYYQQTQSKIYTVTMGVNGYEPSTLHVPVGSTVLFRTALEAPFWPASDPHPTHQAYGDLDPKKPVDPQDVWEFTFTKEGSWRIHDHINPSAKAVIVVGGKDQVVKTYSGVSECDALETESEKISCWDDALKIAYNKGGLPESFNLYEQLFENEPRFAENCHSYTHTIGDKAYEEFVTTGDFGVTAQIAYCSYGFFHGFMDALVLSTGEYKQARDFCDVIDEKIGEETNVYTACLHGIGHGVTDGYDPSIIHDALAIVTPGVELCKTIGKTDYEIKICATGVFNALAALYESEDGPTYDPLKPFAICEHFSNVTYIKAACLDDMKTFISFLTDGDFVAAAKFIEQIPEDEYAIGAIDNLATYRVYNLFDTGFDQALVDCYLIQDRLQSACVRGISVGYMGQGTPGEEYVEAIKVCKSPLVKNEHREECFDRTMTFAQERYSKDKHAQLCVSVADEYQGSGCQM